MEEKGRRKFIKQSALLGTGFYLASSLPFSKSFANGIVQYKLPELGYAYNALEPWIDAETMELHHSKHHQGYVNKLNQALQEKKVSDLSLEQMFARMNEFPLSIRNNGGGHYNHSIYWELLKPGKAEEPNDILDEAILQQFGSVEKLKEQFIEAAMGRFGSGWAWMVERNGKFFIGSTPNQDNPMMSVSEFKGRPILAVDVWEHAYYLKYQNRRRDYLEQFWSLINWDMALKNFIATRK
ncbi:MAG TPA: superoxide dismutase [Bacteroidia bacterium]|nr:superoxide dismutase [Bacteroidia bacterium]HNT79550.1 superoxide dismutase [Bacteroidia bacterium]